MRFRRTALFVAMIALFTGSCTKKYESNGPYVPPYHIDGIVDVEMNDNNPFASMNLSVLYENSVQERVTLSIEGLPAGVSYTIFNPSGYPSFSSQVTFTDSSAAIGTYKVNLVAKGDRSAKMLYPFNVRITPVPDCSQQWLGNFTTNNVCVGGVPYAQSVINTGSANHIQFTNLENAGVRLNAIMNCDFGQITIPQQTINGFTYSGNGSFSTFAGNQQIQLDYFKQPVGGGSGNFCTEVMFR